MGLCGFSATNTEALQGITGRVYQPNVTKRVGLYAHGHNGTQLEAWTSNEGERVVISAIAETVGLPVVSGLLAGDAWGNDGSQTKLSDALAWGGSQFNAKVDKAVLVGVSMGALAALNWARANPAKVACVCLFYPVVNLVAAHDATGGSSDFSAAINTAYTNLAGYQAAAPTHDPAQNAASYAGVPIKMWYSTADTIVGTANQTAFAAAVGGSAFQSQSLGPTGHPDMTVVDPTQVATFVAAHA